MAECKLVLPSMGEGVMEATITEWVKNEGDTINEDDIIIQIATDKVDTDVPSPICGKLLKKLKNINEICEIGEAFAILEVETNTEIEKNSLEVSPQDVPTETHISEVKDQEILKELTKPFETFSAHKNTRMIDSQQNYYSPLVKSIIKKENLCESELKNIAGSGLNGRITKTDILEYIAQKKHNPLVDTINSEKEKLISNLSIATTKTGEIIQMDRMRKLISDHMIHSKQISAHVTSFIEVDVTGIVLWRNKVKDLFYKKEGEKLTFMPIFVEAVAKTLKDFPMINISVKDDTIIKKKNINIGMATALPSGNLIVPVIKNADQLNLAGLAKVINDLAIRARSNNLKPEEIKEGTYTITNLGNFGTIAGTPIINQPQVAILAIGAIVKKPAVIETPQGDMIGIRHKLILSHTYDHRVVDGALGGMFIKKVADYLENFEENIEL